MPFHALTGEALPVIQSYLAPEAVVFASELAPDVHGSLWDSLARSKLLSHNYRTIF